MATKLINMLNALSDYLSLGLREFPDKIGGYHGCLSWCHGSSLKLEGIDIQMLAVHVAINRVTVKERTVPYIFGEAEDEV
jgi:hypothetical protein